MDFDFSINDILRDAVTILDKTAIAALAKSSDRGKRLAQVLDRLGDASAKAQGLPAAITTAFKLMHSDHKLYLLKDEAANSGAGAAVGFIRIGHKRLFVFDNQSRQREMEPLCVLDFYVHESRQRQGHGKLLFEHMIQGEGVKPCHLAIDRPSSKFVSFLQKHYGLKQTVKQVNNFAIFEGFFTNRPDADKKFGKSARRDQEVDVQDRNSGPPADATTGGRRLGPGSNTPDTFSVAASALKAAHLPAPAVRGGDQRLAGNASSSASVAAADTDVLRNVRLQRASDVGLVENKQLPASPKHSSPSDFLSTRNHGSDSPAGMFAQANAYSRHQNSHSAPVRQSPTPYGGPQAEHVSYAEPIRNRLGQSPTDAGALAAAADVLNSHRDAFTSQGHLKLKPLQQPTGHNIPSRETTALQTDVGRPSSISKPPAVVSATAGSHTSYASRGAAASAAVSNGRGAKRAEDTSWSLFGVPSAGSYAHSRHQLARPF